jgi:hypothetical protein
MDNKLQDLISILSSNEDEQMVRDKQRVWFENLVQVDTQSETRGAA